MVDEQDFVWQLHPVALSRPIAFVFFSAKIQHTQLADFGD
jgi:hypothetical protein